MRRDEHSDSTLLRRRPRAPQPASGEHRGGLPVEASEEGGFGARCFAKASQPPLRSAKRGEGVPPHGRTGRDHGFYPWGSTDEKGILLLGALFLSTLTMLIVTVGLTRTFTEMRAAILNLRRTQDFHIAEAALDYGIVAAENQVLTLDQFPSTLNPVASPTLPTISGYTDSLHLYYFDPPFSVAFTGNQQDRLIDDAAIRAMPQLQRYLGMRAIVRPVRVTVDLVGPTGLRTHLQAISDFHLIPIYQFAEFDWNDWSFTPGPEMTIAGAIHANGSIALGPDTGLTIDGTLDATEEFLHIAPGTGYVRIKGSDGSYHDMRNTDGSWLESIDAGGMADIAARWGGKVKAHAPAINLPMPTDASGNPLPTATVIQGYSASDTVELRRAKMFYQADLRIKNGNTVDASNNTLGLATGVTTVNFYDAREQQTMCVTEVDLAALQSIVTDNDSNGRIVYIESTQPSCKNGVRLINGQVLIHPLTIVTHNPLYVVGDYNIGDLNDPINKPKRAASLMADAVTALSSGWTDANATRSTTQRVATSTTLNAALMTSRAWQLESDTPLAEINRTEAYLEHGPASEHMIRFLENWDSRTFTFTGSEVSPWDSQEATQNLACCGDGGAYNAPRRVWAFDTSFLRDSESLPPGTPKIHAVVVSSWRECVNGPCL